MLRAEKFYYNYLIPFYITRSTLLSVDFTNELTDISVGDAWHPDYEKLGQGFSVVVARTEKGENLLREMQAVGVFALEETTVERALSMHGHMIDFKKRGAFIRMGWRRTLGQRVPEYGYRPRPDTAVAQAGRGDRHRAVCGRGDAVWRGAWSNMCRSGFWGRCLIRCGYGGKRCPSR